MARGSGDVVLEVGAGQAEAVETMMLLAGYDRSERIRDLAGIERVVRRGALLGGGGRANRDWPRGTYIFEWTR